MDTDKSESLHLLEDATMAVARINRAGKMNGLTDGHRITLHQAERLMRKVLVELYDEDENPGNA